MNLELFLGFGVLVLITVILRLPFIMTENSDDWATFYRIKKQKGHKWPNYNLDDSIVEGYLGAPRLQYYIVSFFPERFWGAVGNILNIVYELLNVLLVFAFSYLIFNELGDERSGVHALISAGVFSTSPVLFSITPRLTGVKARTLGTFLVTLYLFLLVLAQIEGLWWLLIVCVVIGIASILASAFAMQNLIFHSVFLSILYFNWLPAAMLVAIFGIGWIVPKFSIKKVVYHKINHYWWYMRSYTGTTAQGKNSIVDFFKIPFYLIKNRRKFLNQIFVKQSIIVASYSVPVFWFILSSLWGDQAVLDSILSNPWLKACLYITISGILSFALTALRPFLFLGEAERYFEYVVPFMAILFVAILVNSPDFYIVALFVIVVQISIALAFFIYNEKGRIKRGMAPVRLDEQLGEVVNWLKTQSGQKNILTIPIKYGYVIGYFFKGGEVKVYQTFATNKLDGFKYLSEDMSTYNLPDSDFSYYKEKYNVNIVLIPKEYYFQSKYDYSSSFVGLTPAFENDKFLLFHL